MAGEEESMMSGHKKHRLHHEHRTHHSKHGKQGKSGRVEGERRKVENAIQQTLREKHTKSRQFNNVHNLHYYYHYAIIL